jgi:hypothetical protein
LGKHDSADSPDLALREAISSSGLTSARPYSSSALIGDRTAGARPTIKRADYGLTWNKALDSGGMLVGDDVTDELHLRN